MTPSRLFVAIDLPDQTAGRILELDPRYRGLTFVPPEQMHLTLAFFARVEADVVERLKSNLAEISFRAFFLTLGGLGIFSAGREARILWLDLSQAHPHLFQLHQRVNEAALRCGLPIAERKWTPHFTIARGRGVSASQMKSFLKHHRDLEAGLFRVDHFHLYESTLTSAGAIHHRLLSLPATARG